MKKAIFYCAKTSLFILLCALPCPRKATAQACHLFGFVREGNTGEAIIGAYVYAPRLERGTITNSQGFYSLPLSCEDTVLVIYQSLGYQSDSLLFFLRKDSLADQALRVYTLSEVVVWARARPATIGKISPNLQNLSNMPTLLGEPDILKALALYPGVSNGVEGTVGLHVRGGSADQTLTLLDGSTIYNNGHIFGFLSIFNTGAIKSVDLYKSYFPGRFGGRLSSVADIQMKDGSREKKRHEATLGLISSSLSIDGPLQGSKGSFLLSGRLAHSGLLSLFTLPAYADGEPLIFAGMYDFNCKVSRDIGKDGKLNLSFYAGDDLWGSRVKTDGSNASSSLLNWGNRTAGIRFFKPISANLFWETTFNFNTFRNNYTAIENNNRPAGRSQFGNQSQITEWALGQHLQYTLPKHELKMGVQSKLHAYEPVRLRIKDSGFAIEPARNRIRPVSLSAYLEDSWQATRSLRIDGGLHFSWYSLAEDGYRRWQGEPRLAINFLPRAGKQWSASYSRMVQDLHLVNITGTGLPYDIWLPATRRLPSQSAHILAMAYRQDMAHYAFSAEVFYKSLDNQVDLPSGNSLIVGPASNAAWQEQVATEGEGWAYGIELLLEKQAGKLAGTLAYTYSRSFRRFETINNGRDFPYLFDRPHDLALTANYSFDNSWSLSGNFIYQTGRPVSLPEAVGRDFFGEIDFIYVNRNNRRLPDYHRLDIMASKKFHTRKRGRSASLSMGVYNLYARANALYIDIGGEYLGRFPDFSALKLDFQAGTFFRFIPALNYTVKW